MKVVKILCHSGVDTLLKSVLKDDLTIINPTYINRATGPTDADSYKNLKCELLNNPADLIKKDWNLAIIDDVFTAFLFEHTGIKDIPLVWYCHGTYEFNKGAQSDLKKYCSGLPVMFPSCYKREKVLSWLPKPAIDTVLPITLPDSFYRAPGRVRNGKTLIPGNNILEKLIIYPNADRAKQTLKRLLKMGCHTTGWGFENQRFNWLGYVHPLKSLNNYSCAAIVNNAPSPGFCQLEMMAAGVPVVMFAPKEDFSKSVEGEEGYFLVDTEEEFIGCVERLQSNEVFSSKVGAAGVAYLQKNFPWKKYSENLYSFFGKSY